MNENPASASVIILGAGFSAAATQGRMPLMRGYFDQLSDQEFPLLYDLVRVVDGDPSTANVETVLLALDQFKTSPAVALEGWADKWKLELPQLRRDLSAYTLKRIKSALIIDEGNWAIDVLAKAPHKTTVISMNYDNIADRILSNRAGIKHGKRGTCPHCKMRLLLQKACSCDARNNELSEADWHGALIKPHGSIAWKRCLNPECCAYDCLVADERCQPFMPCSCPTCKQECGPVMVMPTMSKSLDEFPEIGIMWKAARLAICNAESILLFGFSMPSSDELLMQMVRQSIHCNRKLRRVMSIDLSPGAVLGRFRRCVPTDLDVEFIEFPVEIGETPNWLFDEAESTPQLAS